MASTLHGVCQRMKPMARNAAGQEMLGSRTSLPASHYLAQRKAQELSIGLHRASFMTGQNRMRGQWQRCTHKQQMLGAPLLDWKNLCHQVPLVVRLPIYQPFFNQRMRYSLHTSPPKRPSAQLHFLCPVPAAQCMALMAPECPAQGAML